MSRWKLAGPTPWRSLVAIAAIGFVVALLLDAPGQPNLIRYFSTRAGRSDVITDLLILGLILIPAIAIERTYFWWRRRRRQ